MANVTEFTPKPLKNKIVLLNVHQDEILNIFKHFFFVKNSIISNIYSNVWIEPPVHHGVLDRAHHLQYHWLNTVVSVFYQWQYTKLFSWLFSFLFGSAWTKTKPMTIWSNQICWLFFTIATHKKMVKKKYAWKIQSKKIPVHLDPVSVVPDGSNGLLLQTINKYYTCATRVASRPPDVALALRRNAQKCTVRAPQALCPVAGGFDEKLRRVGNNSESAFSCEHGGILRPDPIKIQKAADFGSVTKLIHTGGEGVEGYW